MKPENLAERKKMLMRFGLLYVASIALVVLTFLFMGSRPGPAETSASHGKGLPSIHPDGLLPENRTADSIQQELTQIRKILVSKDSLITAYRNESLMPSTSDRTGNATNAKDSALNAKDQQAIAKLIKENSANHQDINQLQVDNTTMQQRLAEEQKNNVAANEQLSALRQKNDKLQARLDEDDHAATSANDAQKTAAETQRNALAGKNAALERRSAELADQLRFAEVDCNLSRADARQIVYNARQRQDLLTDALTTLTELSKSSDAEVRKKAEEKLAVLRNIAGMVHD